MMTSTITARVDAEKKKQAEAIFSDLGMTLSGAVSVFINECVVYQGIPFAVRKRLAFDSRMEEILDQTDAYCQSHTERLSHSEVFGRARKVLHAGRSVHA